MYFFNSGFAQNCLWSCGRRVWKPSWGAQESTSSLRSQWCFRLRVSLRSQLLISWDHAVKGLQGTGPDRKGKCVLELGGSKKAAVGIQCCCLLPPNLFTKQRQSSLIVLQLLKEAWLCLVVTAGDSDGFFCCGVWAGSLALFLLS